MRGGVQKGGSFSEPENGLVFMRCVRGPVLCLFWVLVLAFAGGLHLSGGREEIAGPWPSRK